MREICKSIIVGSLDLMRLLITAFRSMKKLVFYDKLFITADFWSKLYFGINIATTEVGLLSKEIKDFNRKTL